MVICKLLFSIKQEGLTSSNAACIMSCYSINKDVCTD